MAKGKRSGKSLKRSPVLFDLLRRRPESVLRVLDRHGVYFDPGTYLTLSARPEKVAAYHAVPDLARFLSDLERASERRGR